MVSTEFGWMEKKNRIAKPLGCGMHVHNIHIHWGEMTELNIIAIWYLSNRNFSFLVESFFSCFTIAPYEPKKQMMLMMNIFCTLPENKVDGYAIYFILVIGNDSTKNFILMLSTIIINQVKFVCYIWRIFCYTHIIWMLESIVCILTRDNFSSASMHFFLTSISRYFFAVNPS